MKLIKTIIFEIFCFALFIVSVKAATFEFSETLDISDNCEVGATLYIDATEERVNASDIEIQYDPSIIKIIDAEPDTPGIQINTGEAFSKYWGNVVDESQGKILLAGGNFPIQDILTTKEIFAKIFFNRITIQNNNVNEPIKFIINFQGAGKTIDSNIAESDSGYDILDGVIDGDYADFGSCIPIIVTPSPITSATPTTTPTPIPGSDNVVIEELPLTGVIENFAELSLPTIIVASGVATITALFGSINYLRLLFFPWKRRKRFWGLVYDRESGTAIPLATIRIFREGEKSFFKQTTSDFDGRYGLVVDPGNYHIEIEHFEYIGLKISSATGEYYGQVFQIEKTTNVNLDIPMLKISGSKRKFIFKIKMKLNLFLGLFVILYPYILSMFLVINIIFLLVSKEAGYFVLSIYHLILLIFFFVLYNKYPKHWCNIFNSQDKKPVPLSMIKLFDRVDNSLADTKISDEKGRFQLILPEGDYQIIVAKSNYQFPSTVNRIYQDGKGKVVIKIVKEPSFFEIPVDPTSSGEITSKFGVL